MLDSGAIVRETEEIVAEWQAALKGYSDEQLAFQPAEDEWSIGQVYQHVITAALYFLKQSLRCMGEDAEEGGEGKNPTGDFVFTLQAFPDRPIRLPEHRTRSPRQPADREEIRKGLEAVLERLHKTAKELPTADSERRIRHPLFGMLNAAEWFRLPAWHSRHHLRQKTRLDALLAVRSNRVG